MEKSLANRNKRYRVEGSDPPDALQKGKTFTNIVETNPVVTVKESASPNVTKIVIAVVIGIVGIAAVVGVVAVVVVLTTKGDDGEKTTDQTPQTSVSPFTSTTSELAVTSTTTEPVEGLWSAWGDWTQCTAICNSGIHKRYRRCNGQDTTECVGDFVETEICEETVCPVYGKWTTWGSWGSCDVTCGGGTQSRTRACSKADSADLECVGSNSQDKICSNWECPDCTRECTVGVLNTDCDTCLCDGTVITGRVRAVSTGNPISNAALYASTAPTKLLSQSNSTGFFTLDAICTTTELLITRDGFVDKNVVISSDYLEINLTKLVLPYLTETPQTKFRLSGEDVTLCCEAVANPSVDYYEWLKDDILLDETLFLNGNMLTLSDLTIADSGRYQCRANSPAGAIMSPAATLSVKAVSDDFCSDALQQKTVALPDDCVQPGINTATYEVGECISKSCRGNTTTDTGSCREDISSCCTVGEADLETVQCSGYELELVIVRSCSCAVCSSNSLTISGMALALEDGSPLKYGEVFVNGVFEGYTSNSGAFNFIVSKTSTTLTINLKDTNFRQFLPAIKVIGITDEMSGVLRVEIRMIKAVEPVEIDSTTENTLVAGSSVSGGNSTTPVVQISIPPNAFYYSDGTQYNGTIAASLTFLDPTNTTVLDNIPGVFQFVDDEGQAGNLASLGVFNLYFEDTSGNPLVLDEVLDLYIPLSVGENVTNKNIRLWKMNTETGSWEYVTPGTGTRRRKRQDTALWIGEIDWSTVTDEEWFNYDYVYGLTERRCFFKIRVFKDEALTKSPSRSVWRFRVDYHIFKDGTLTSIYDYLYSPERECVIGLCDGDNAYVILSTYGRNGYEGLYAAAPELGTSGLYYEITDENKILKIEMSASANGPFYKDEIQCQVSNSKNFHLRYHFGEKTEVFTFNKFYSAVRSNGYQKNRYISQRTWYPNREYEGYSVCFMKVRILFEERFHLAYNEVIKLKVTSYGGTNQNIKDFLLGIREYIIADTENSTLCVEYKCSGIIDPDFDKEFDYTKVVLTLVFPNDNIDCAIAQEADFVSYEPLSRNSAQLGRTNGTYDVFLPAIYIPELGIYSATSDKLDIDSATNTAEGECRSGQPQVLDEDNPDIGVSVSFVCENTCPYYDYWYWYWNFDC